MAKLPGNFLLEPTPHKEAAKWLRTKPTVSREVFDELLPELKGRAFTITGLEDAAVARDIRDAIAQVPEGEDYEKTKRELEAKLGPWFDEKAASRRAELLVRMHGFQAYRSTAREVHDRQAAVFKFRQYVSMDDGRVRPSHRALHGVILPADSPFWQTHPGGWGCRCDEVALLPSERDEIAAEDAKKPLEERRVIEGPRLSKLEKEGKLVHFIKGPDGKAIKPPLHEWNVRNPDAIGSPQSLRIDPALLKSRYDPETWAEFEASAKRGKLDDGRTVWEWLNGKKAPKITAPPPKEAWARAYAQFIAEESSDETMAAQVSEIRAEVLPDRQWQAADFAPVRAAMGELFTSWGWKKKAP